MERRSVEAENNNSTFFWLKTDQTLAFKRKHVGTHPQRRKAVSGKVSERETNKQKEAVVQQIQKKVKEGGKMFQ